MTEHPLLRLPPRDEDGHVNVVVETPRGSVHKLTFDAERGVMVLKKALPAGLAFPFEFGFVPRTVADDGDPVDVVVLLDGAVPPAVVVAARLVGVIEAEQRRDGETQRNDRLVAVGVLSRRFGEVREVDELPSALLDDLSRFFAAYTTALGTDFRVLGRSGVERANALLDAAIARADADR